MHYAHVITQRNIKFALVSIWTLSALSELLRFAAQAHWQATVFSSTVFSLVIVCCVLFIVISYVMFRETSRHRRHIMTEHIPQEEVRRFTRENKSLKTTSYCVDALMLHVCCAPLIFLSIPFQFKVLLYLVPVAKPWFPSLTALKLALKSSYILLATGRNEKICV